MTQLNCCRYSFRWVLSMGDREVVEQKTRVMLYLRPGPAERKFNCGGGGGGGGRGAKKTSPDVRTSMGFWKHVLL